MPFAEGHLRSERGGGSKPGERRGGRKPGVPNKIYLHTREELRQYCDQRGADPGKVLADTMMETKDVRIRVLCAELLLDRLLPKLKSIELTGVEEKPLYLLTGRCTPAERERRKQRIAELEAQRKEQAEHEGKQS